MEKAQIFSDVFEVSDMDPHGKKFDRVSRVIGQSENIEMTLTLDVNCELYPMKVGEKFTFVLARSLSLDGYADDAKKDSWRDNGAQRSLADDFDYVMYGKVYKYDDTAGAKVSVYASFGGLLMQLSGDYRPLQEINVGQNLYLLMRK
ncbi:RNA polymerase [Polychytrium aggregatum]|uniref:RNA polymerase n=1 Tax=Polychytrium aggregatum TaxID=110093 RepID=UPI0022FDE96F|nr:RNA polymerase [Polychytrium aggregatum]KAI9208818.1 RNA polymerase [Polychytrium aggregatum]